MLEKAVCIGKVNFSSTTKVFFSYFLFNFFIPFIYHTKKRITKNYKEEEEEEGGGGGGGGGEEEESSCKLHFEGDM